MKPRVSAGGLEAGKPEGFNRAERARWPCTVRGRPARGSREHRRRERVRIAACQANHGQLRAARIARYSHHVRTDGLPGGPGPAALNPAGLQIQRPG
jgi:hypothetical protein